MNKLMTVAALAVLLAACAKNEAEAPVADAGTEAAPAAEAAATEEAAAAPAEDAVADAAAADVGSGLPQACEDYLNRAKACFDKSSGNAAAAAFQQGVEQVRAQWDQVADKSALETACKAANDQFGQTASILKCE